MATSNPTKSDSNKSKKRGLDADSDSESASIVSSSWPRFLVIKSMDPSRPVGKLSPFAIAKGLKGLAGELADIKKMRSGDLLVECTRRAQSDNLRQCTQLVNIPVQVQSHQSKNTSKGVIRSPDLSTVTEDEMLEELQSQAVLAVKRITIRRGDRTIHTNTFILTFDCATPPKSIKAGYLNIEVRLYIPNPLRCFKCQKYGHGQSSCSGSQVCFRCGKEGHGGDSCQERVQCANCKGNHMASSKDCPMWSREKEVQKIKTERNCSFPEARRILGNISPSPGNRASYATVVKPKLISVSCQTEVSCAGGVTTTLSKAGTTQTPPAEKTMLTAPLVKPACGSSVGGVRPKDTASGSGQAPSTQKPTPPPKPINRPTSKAQASKASTSDKATSNKTTSKPKVVKPKYNSSRPSKMMEDLVKVNMLEGEESEEMDILNYDEENLDEDLPPISTLDTSKSKISTGKGNPLLPSLSS